MTQPTPQQRAGHVSGPHRNGPSEFSWGTGITPSGLEDAPPSQGGRYCGTTPDMTEPAALAQLRKLIAKEE